MSDEGERIEPEKPSREPPPSEPPPAESPDGPSGEVSPDTSPFDPPEMREFLGSEDFGEGVVLEFVEELPTPPSPPPEEDARQ